MTTRKKTKLEKPLTEVELEIMNIAWLFGESPFTVKDVQSRLSHDRDLAYTSVATMMKILEQKGALSSQKSDRAHLYMSLITREQYEGTSLRHLADHLFHGDPSMMVMRLLDDRQLTPAELQEIKKLLDSRLSQ